MSKLVVYFGDNPACVEGFSESCKRSNAGALYLYPKKQKTITDDEFKHIQESRKDLMGKIRMIADKPDVVAEATMTAEKKSIVMEKKTEPKSSGAEEKMMEAPAFSSDKKKK